MTSNAPAPGYTEGPTWIDGDVFFCSGALLRITPEKKVLKYLDIGPAGTYLLADKRLLIADNKYHALLQLTPDAWKAWRPASLAIDENKIATLIEARNAARKARDFKEADRIRDELAAMGIQLKDAKDPATGEIKTTWEVKR